MLTLKQAYNLRVGYSDHTIGTEVPVAAVALGAEYIEKHLTLDKTMSGPDHRASLDMVEFAEMVRQIRNIEIALGSGIKWPNPSEEKIKQLVRRRIVSSCNLAANTRIDWKHLSFKRSEKGLSVDQVEEIIGQTLRVDVIEDTPITWDILTDRRVI